MSTTLAPILEALGHRGEENQRDFVKLLHASGAFGNLPDVEGTLTDLQALAILRNVTFDDPEQAAHWLHKTTQKNMLRPAGKERYECEESEYFKQNRGELLNALHRLGTLSEVKPKAKHYDHVLVLGTMEGAVSTRLDMLGELWNEGIRFDKIHLLGSERPLDPAHERFASVATDVGSVATEMQMMIARAYEKSETWPEALQNIKLNPVTTPNQAHGRANTRDTIESWMKSNPQPGRVLVIASQPYVAYQDAAVKSALPPSFEVDTVGARVSEDHLKISVAMDSIARQIDVGFPKLLEALKNKSSVLATPLLMFDPAAIQVDANAYQFRSGGNAAGVTKHNPGSQSWDPILDGDPLLVHKRIENGVPGYYIVDGHHRRAKAVELNAKGQGPGQVAAMVLDERYSIQDAKIVGAYKNMARQLAHEGVANPIDLVDAANAFKEAESIPFDHRKLLPSLRLDGNVNLKIAYDMRNLPKPALAMVATGEVPADMAVQVAQQAPNDPVQQESVMRHISARLNKGFRGALTEERATPAAISRA